MDVVTGDANSSDYFSRVIRGLIPNVSRTAQVGEVSVPTTASVPIDICTTPVALPTAAVSLEVVSNNVNDTAAGTGCESVVIVGLDASYNSISATVQLNGTTPVAVPTQFFRINSVRGAMVTPNTAVSQNNIGTITIRDAGGGTTRALITPGTGLCKQSLFTVPAGFQLQIRSIELQIISSGGGTARGADALLMIRSPTGFLTSARKLSATDTLPDVLDAVTYIPIAEKFDFWMRCTYTSNNTMTVNASYEAHLYRL